MKILLCAFAFVTAKNMKMATALALNKSDVITPNFV
jgi:hypothetical protein